MVIATDTSVLTSLLEQEYPPLSLAPEEIHLWLADYEEINEGWLHSAYRKLLSATERQQERRFYFARDQGRYLVTRALVRTVLSRYVTVNPKEWVFSTTTYGRPEIVNAQARSECLSFSISHTHSIIILAVTKRRAVGVDIENVRSRKIEIEVADRCFAPEEVAALAAVSSPEQQHRFFEYWTFKEAYIKARGMGLFLPLNRFSFRYPSDRTVEIAIHPKLNDDAGRWQFWQFRPAPEYLMAICAERLNMGQSSLVARQVVPLVNEQRIILDSTRASSPSFKTDHVLHKVDAKFEIPHQQGPRPI
jgi:4'-phosphopantetheinyl transferase